MIELIEHHFLCVYSVLMCFVRWSSQVASSLLLNNLVVP